MPRAFVRFLVAPAVLLLILVVTVAAGCTRGGTSLSKPVLESTTQEVSKNSEEVEGLFRGSASSSSAAVSPSTIVPQSPSELNEFLKSCEGRPVVLAFWSTHCPPCREETKSLGELSRSIETAVAFAIVATEPKADADSYLAQRGLGHVPIVEDEKLEICNTYRVYAIPAIIVLDEKRQVVASLHGQIQQDTEHQILSALQ